MDFSRFAYRPNLTNIDNNTNYNEENEVDLTKADSPIVRIERNQQLLEEKSSNNSSDYPGLKELLKSPNEEKEKVLRMIIIGHNPSHQSWIKGHYYANPANRMWPILTKAEIVPRHFTCYNDQDCPSLVGLGFTDILLGLCETQSSNIEDRHVAASKTGLYTRLIEHCERVSKDHQIPVDESYPRIIAFAGVRQYRSLFEDEEKQKKNRKRKEPASSSTIKMDMFYDLITKSKKSRKLTESASASAFSEVVIELDNDDESVNNREESVVSHIPLHLQKEFDDGKWTISGEEGKTCFGVQKERPVDWPKQLEKSTIILLPSTSGAAAMTTEAREGPYILLGKLLRHLQYEYSEKYSCQLPVWRCTNDSKDSTIAGSGDELKVINSKSKAVEEISLLDDD